MELKLYHYVHCPFCIRVRMTLGFLGMPFESIVLPYDDETTPVALTGSKMLPIMVVNGKPMNESLDIMAMLDKNNALKIPETITSPEFKQFGELLDRLASGIHNLAMPYFIYTPEFNEASRTYFQKKKEQKRGPFKELVHKRKQYETQLMLDLEELSRHLTPFYHSSTFSVFDILLASHIWGMYIVPEFQFPEKIHTYLQKVKENCHFDYHQDFWK